MHYLSDKDFFPDLKLWFEKLYTNKHYGCKNLLWHQLINQALYCREPNIQVHYKQNVINYLKIKHLLKPGDI